MNFCMYDVCENRGSMTLHINRTCVACYMYTICTPIIINFRSMPPSSLTGELSTDKADYSGFFQLEEYNNIIIWLAIHH